MSVYLPRVQNIDTSELATSVYGELRAEDEVDHSVAFTETLKQQPCSKGQAKISYTTVLSLPKDLSSFFSKSLKQQEMLMKKVIDVDGKKLDNGERLRT